MRRSMLTYSASGRRFLRHSRIPDSTLASNPGHPLVNKKRLSNKHLQQASQQCSHGLKIMCNGLP